MNVFDEAPKKKRTLKLETVQDVQEHLTQILRDLDSELITSTQARTQAALCKDLVACMKVTNLEKRIEQMEQSGGIREEIDEADIETFEERMRKFREKFPGYADDVNEVLGEEDESTNTDH